MQRQKHWKITDGHLFQTVTFFKKILGKTVLRIFMRNYVIPQIIYAHNQILMLFRFFGV